jgi:iduronate 2-sulfatase
MIMKSAMHKVTGLGARVFLAGVLVLGVAVGDGRAGERKNVLFIAVDDLKPLLGCYGETQIQSPRIDELAARGTVFLNAHCQQAICGPSRASLMTGMRPDHIGVWDLKTKLREVNPGIVTLPEYFRGEGYETSAVGKIYDPRNMDGRATHDAVSWSIPYTAGWDLRYDESRGGKPVDSHYQSEEAHGLIAEAAEQGLEDYAEVEAFLASKEFHPVMEFEDLPDNAYEDGAMTDRALDLMDEMAAGEKPFFLAVGLKKPHLPFVAPRKYWDLYDADAIEVHPFQEHSKDGPEEAYHDSSELRGYSPVPKEGAIPEELQKELIHAYYACVSYIDAQVGRLVDGLKERGLEEDTVIVLWGDHGWHLGDHGLWCKHSNFEQATRSPLIVAVPGMAGGERAAGPVDFVDIFPTVCDLAGLAVPEGLDGVSLRPVLEDAEATVRPYAVSQFPRGKAMGYALRTDRYRYVAWLPKEGDEDIAMDLSGMLASELYDYEMDAMETVNVVGDPAYEEIAGELSRLMEEYLADQSVEKEE